MKLLRNLAVIAVAIGCTTAQAAYLSIADNVGGIPAEWTKTAAFSQFNPALGTLTSINLQVTTTLNVAETLKNTGAASQNFQFQMTEDVHFQDPGQLFSGDALSATALTPYTLGAGASSTLTTNVSGLNTNYTGVTTPSVLSAYTGTGNINFTVSTLTGASIYGGGGVITATNDPVVSSVITLYYYYTPPPPPSPTPPTLGIATYSNQPALFYPAAGNSRFVVQMATNLTSPTWITVTNYTLLTGILVTNAPENAFFRLN